MIIVNLRKYQKYKSPLTDVSLSILRNMERDPLNTADQTFTSWNQFRTCNMIGFMFVWLERHGTDMDQFTDSALLFQCYKISIEFSKT